MHASIPFERRPERTGLVSLRVSKAERRELEQLARNSKASISDVLREGLAHLRRLHADAECTVGSEP